MIGDICTCYMKVYIFVYSMQKLYDFNYFCNLTSSVEVLVLNSLFTINFFFFFFFN